MTKEEIDTIFDRFRQVDQSSTRVSGGVGLGLYIVRRTVEAMGGSVRCVPSPAGGAAFVVRLPSATVDLTDGVVAPAALRSP